MSKNFKKLPSEILRIEGEYEAFCFDECCSYILEMLSQGKEPSFPEDKKRNATLEMLKAGLL